MNESLKRQLTILKYHVLNRSLLRQIATTERNLTLSAAQLQELQWKKLRGLLAYAYQNCSYYREKYRSSGVRPEDIRSFADFQRVPSLTKSEIKNNLERLVPAGINRDMLKVAFTAGTTGVPLRIYRDGNKNDLMHALYLRTIRMWGCDLGAKTVWIWGIPNMQEKHDDFRYQSKILRHMKNTTWFNAFDLTSKNMREFTYFLNRFRPSLVIGYVSALCEYARFLDEHDLRIHPPQAIWLTAEPADTSQRTMIERTLGAETFSQYGSSEVLHIAAECSDRSGLHINADSRYVEITNSNDTSVPPGDTGYIVVTDLENKVMPLIRYKNGDISSLGEKHCNCGSNLPMMDYVEGRIYDMITLRNGKKIYGHMFSRVLFQYVEQIRQFQVHQLSLDRIIVRIVPEKSENFCKLKGEILSAFQRYTGNSIKYSFEIVDYVKKEQSGKLRYVKSDV